MPRQLILIALAFSLLLPAQALAQGASERVQSKRDAHTSIAVNKRDKKELYDFRKTKEDFAAAVKAKNSKKALRIHRKLLAMMNREIKQGDNNIKRAKRELAQSRSEYRKSRMDAHHAKIKGKKGKSARDDRRDFQDDNRDLKNMQKRQNKKRQLQKKFKVYKPAKHAKHFASLQNKASIAQSFEDVMKVDYRFSYNEEQEDRRELREDRRDR